MICGWKVFISLYTIQYKIDIIQNKLIKIGILIRHKNKEFTLTSIILKTKNE